MLAVGGTTGANLVKFGDLDMKKKVRTGGTCK